MNITKSLLFAISIVVLGLVFFSQVMTKVDALLGFKNFQSIATLVLGGNALLIGAILRLWAAFLFYSQGIKVIAVHAQDKLVTAGPYKFSRNPLYLGIICIAFGSAIIFGSISGFALSVVIFIGWNLWVRLCEEKQLEQKFGAEYARYKQRVPRWFRVYPF